MRCTVLVDNQADPSRAELRTEHGLSLLIQTQGSTILFDSGASSLLVQNAKHLGIDLQTVDALVLSHGHYDHGGGLATFLKINSRAIVYCGPGAAEPHFVKLFGLLPKDIGLNRKALGPFSSRFVTVDETGEILPGVYALPLIPLVRQVPKDLGMFYKKTKGHLEKDDFSHEILLAIRDAGGLTVLTGCAHKGILNVVSAATANFLATPIQALIGGLHMTNPLTKRLSETQHDISSIGAELRKNDGLMKLYTGHCTGPKAYALLRQEMGTKIDTLTVGKQILV